jgi:hypothetical protein
MEEVDVKGLSTSFALRSKLGRPKTELRVLILNLSSVSREALLLPLISFFKVFLKFLKETRTTVTLSSVLFAIDALSTSSTL